MKTYLDIIVVTIMTCFVICILIVTITVLREIVINPFIDYIKYKLNK